VRFAVLPARRYDADGFEIVRRGLAVVTRSELRPDDLLIRIVYQKPAVAPVEPTPEVGKRDFEQPQNADETTQEL
jgi:hypothetical protein